jgi:hypothetical protein
MALGTFGSTLNDELNRLANGGTYRTMGNMVDEALAAKQWANREYINPYSTDTVGILNEIAGLGLDKRNWLDFNGVCNYLAGTTGLPAAAALRQIQNTSDLLTSNSAYYIDATAPTNWGALGYIRLPGVNGNYLSVPDANNLDITGDLDIRVRVALDDWTPTAVNCLLAKEETSTTRSYRFTVNTTGTLVLVWSGNGSAITTVESSVATGITDGAIKWVRAARVASTGTVQFFTSDNGTAWTQLGTDISAASGNIFSSTSQVSLGGRLLGTAEPLAGNLYRAQVLNGIGGTTVLDVNIATDYLSSNQSFFTATTGQTVTVNGVDVINNLGTGADLLPTTLGSSTAADSNDPKFLDFTGTNYVYLPGASGNTLSVPDAAALDITGDIDIRVRVAPDDWTPSADTNLTFKSVAAGDQRSWQLLLRSTGGLQFVWYSLGTGASAVTVNSTATLGLADGTAKWVRVTLDVDNGASGNDVKFWTSDDGSTWTQLGSTVTTAGTTSIYASTADVFFGSTTLAAKLFKLQVFNGIDGTKVLDVDTSVITAGSTTSFTAVTGQTVTINRSTTGRKTVAVTQPVWLFGTDDYMEVNNRYMSSGTYLYLPGVAGNYASTPDSAAVSVTGDIDLRAKVAMDDWTPGTDQYFISKWTTNQRAYYLGLTTAGNIILTWSTNGTTTTNYNQSASSVSLVDGTTKWIRATLDVDNGSSQHVIQYFTSDDGTTWTQLGATVTNAGTTSIFDGSSVLEVGSAFIGTSTLLRGKMFRAQVLNGIGGTVAFDANFETSITSLLQTSFTESSANAATVTINRSGSAYRSAGITAAGYLYPGATNTFKASATDLLNFGAADSFTVLAVARQWATPQNVGFWLSKKNVSSPFDGWGISSISTTLQPRFNTFDGTTSLSSDGTLFTSGANLVLVGLFNRTSSTQTIYQNGTLGGTANISVNRALSNLYNLRIGSGFTGAQYQDAEIYATAIFRSALTAAQIRQISNYFANREVYL